MKQALPLIIRRMNQIIILALYIKDQQKSRVRSALKTPSSSLKVTEGWPSASLCIDELAEFTHKLDFPESHHKLIWCQLSVSPWCGGSLSKTEEELFFGFWRSSVRLLLLALAESFQSSAPTPRRKPLRNGAPTRHSPLRFSQILLVSNKTHNF